MDVLVSYPFEPLETWGTRQTVAFESDCVAHVKLKISSTNDICNSTCLEQYLAACSVEATLFGGKPDDLTWNIQKHMILSQIRT